MGERKKHTTELSRPGRGVRDRVELVDFREVPVLKRHLGQRQQVVQLPRGEIIVDVVDFRAIPAPTRHPVQHARTDQLRMKHTHPRTREESQEHRTHFEAPRKHVHSA